MTRRNVNQFDANADNFRFVARNDKLIKLIGHQIEQYQSSGGAGRLETGEALNYIRTEER
jgi:hypothetical protein